MPKPPINPQPPSGGLWNNIAYTDMNNIQTCANLITNSTASSGLNANSNSSPVNISTNIKAKRTALWLKSGGLVTIAFHSFDGPSNPAGRYPKFCVCAGVDESLTPLPYPLPTSNPVYQWISNAVSYFAENNQGNARIYLLVGQNQPEPDDWIYPIFQCAITNDIAFTEGETTLGVAESYAQGAKPRWPINITTWKLRKV